MKTKKNLKSIRVQSFVTSMASNTANTIQGKGWTGGVTRTLLVDPKSEICCDM